MEDSNRKVIIRIVVAAILLVATKFFIVREDLKFILIVLAYFIVGYDVLIRAIKSLITEFSLDETVLMSIATIGAFLLGENFEAVFVMLFYQIGELFQDYSYDKSKDNIKNLIDINVDYANIYVDGKIERINPSSIKVNDIIVINPYEKIPIDGEIVDGSTTLNTSMLTGESIPRYVSVGDYVASGLINNDSVIRIKALKEFKDSTASKILELIENATEKKAKSENFITSFAKVYTPVVCLIAILTFLLPTLYEYFVSASFANMSTYAYRALTILVISCPCAILISVPLAFFSSLGSASKLGILVKGSNYIETLSKVSAIAFDKTGTMTKGVFEVVGIHHCKMDENDLVKLVAHIEYFSNHPIAKSILKYYAKDVDIDSVRDVKEIGGRGLCGIVFDKKILVGNEKLMNDSGISYIKCSEVGTIVHVAIDGVYEGHILIDDVIKENAKASIDDLKRLGIKRNVMLTGDAEDIAKKVSDIIGLDEYHASLLPEDKLKYVDELIKDNTLAFVGDGINDAPCITRADVGIAMGGIGSDSAIDLADIVIMDDEISNVPRAIRLCKITMRIVYENIIMAIGIKILVLILSMFGISNMWLAIFSDVGVMVIAVLNSVRLLYVHKFLKNK